jgi:hypothetical protein
MTFLARGAGPGKSPQQVTLTVKLALIQGATALCRRMSTLSTPDMLLHLADRSHVRTIVLAMQFGRLSMLAVVQTVNYRFFLHAQYTARSLAKPGYRCLNSSDMCT